MVSGKVRKSGSNLADEGIITVAAAVDGMLMKPEVHLRGVVTSIDEHWCKSGCKNRLKQSRAIAGQIFARP